MTDTANSILRYVEGIFPKEVHTFRKWQGPIRYQIDGLSFEHMILLRNQAKSFAELTGVEISEWHSPARSCKREAELSIVFATDILTASQQHKAVLKIHDETEYQYRVRTERLFRLGWIMQMNWVGDRPRHAIHVLNSAAAQFSAHHVLTRLLFRTLLEVGYVDPTLRSVQSISGDQISDLSNLDKLFLRAAYSSAVAHGMPIGAARAAIAERMIL